MWRISSESASQDSVVSFPSLPAQETYSRPSSTSSRSHLSEKEKEAFFADPMSIVGKEFIMIYIFDEIPYKVESVLVVLDSPHGSYSVSR